MASGHAKRMHERNGVPVLILDVKGRPRWHPIWENNPRIARTASGRFQLLRNGPGARDYIAAKSPTRWTWKASRLTPGEIYLSEAERSFAREHAGHVIVEPNVKGTNEGNKDWGFERWQEFARRTPNLLQLGPPGARRLDGVPFIETADFRLAAAVLAVSKAYVGAEGAMHHAAAAMSVPAVVLFGGFISPDVTGYAAHRNLFTGGRACGSRVACEHCRRAMDLITVEMVASNLKEIL